MLQHRRAAVAGRRTEAGFQGAILGLDSVLVPLDARPALVTAFTHSLGATDAQLLDDTSLASLTVVPEAACTANIIAGTIIPNQLDALLALRLLALHS